jgi:predicted deacetylase
VPLSLLLAPRKAVPGDALDWVRRRVAAGDALVLHGFDHQPDPTHRAVSLRRRAEFSALPAHEAGLRLVAARAALERLGLATDLFAPPGWLASPGTVVALRRHRFAVCADMAGVRDLRTGDVRTGRVRVVGDHWSYLLGVGRAARRGGLVRIGADAADLDRLGPREVLLEAVDLALHHGASPATYSSTASPRGTTSTPSGAVPTRTR